MNRAHIQQETKIIRHNNRSYERVVVYDDYSGDHLNLSDASKVVLDFFDNPIDVLKFVLREIDNNGYPYAENIIQNTIDNRDGMWIEGEYFVWEKLYPIFKEFNLVD